MKSVLVYTVTCPEQLTEPIEKQHVFVRARGHRRGDKVGAWIRVEISEADYKDAMFHAKPLPGETFSNSHPLV